MESLKREMGLRQPKAARQWLMSYLIQELTKGVLLLSFTLDHNFHEGDIEVVFVCMQGKLRCHMSQIVAEPAQTQLRQYKAF